MILRSHRQTLESPYSSLVAFFILWKGFLLLLACLSPSPGYDTSTNLLFQLEAIPLSSHTVLQRLADTASEKLVSWDAIYFTSIAQHGYVYEQEWAFGWGFAMLSRVVAKGREFHRRMHFSTKLNKIQYFPLTECMARLRLLCWSPAYPTSYPCYYSTDWPRHLHQLRRMPQSLS